MAIDNYIVNTSSLRTLKLIAVGMNIDHFVEIAGTLEISRTLQRLDLSNNCLRNAGCREIASVLNRNKSLRKLTVSRNDIKDDGIITLLRALKTNATLTCLRAEGNKFNVTRYLLALIGNLVVYENNCIERLQLGGGKHGLLNDENFNWD